jgi:integrase
MAEDTRSLTRKSLSLYARRARIAAVAAFFRDAIAWGWPDMPSRPLLDHRDMPRMPKRIPRYIPADELARLMTAIAGLPCPFQRAALLVARWSGARRGEICRLSVDCLDAYPDSTARLRIPAGKTLKERVVPLHEQAAEALRAIIALRSGGPERPLLDERTGTRVRYLFLRHGRPMSAFYLFEYSLRDACKARRRVIVRHRDDHPRGARSKSRTERIVDLHEAVTLEAVSAYVMSERPADAISPLMFLVGGHGPRRNEPLSHAGLVRLFARTCERAGSRAPWVTPHALRHTHATRMWEAGMRQLTLQKRLGHASAEATGLYTRVSDASVVSEYRRALGLGQADAP